jgi:hypothetical protein
VGIEDPAFWVTTVFGAAGGGGLGTVIFRLLKAKIDASHSERLAEMALKDTKPEERALILEGLAKVRPFHPGSATSEGDSAGVIRSAARGRRRA